VTFRYGASGPEGLVTGKKVYFALARGGKYRDTSEDVQVPWLRKIFAFIGLTDQTFLYAEGLAMGPSPLPPPSPPSSSVPRRSDRGLWESTAWDHHPHRRTVAPFALVSVPRLEGSPFTRRLMAPDAVPKAFAAAEAEIEAAIP